MFVVFGKIIRNSRMSSKKLRSQVKSEATSMEQITKQDKEEDEGTSKKGTIVQQLVEESTSTYFSPKKTRNFMKKNDLSLAKKLENVESTEKLSKKSQKRNTKQEGEEGPSNETKKPIKKYVYVENDHWQPVKWPDTLEAIQKMRKNTPAPVDTMGCDKYSTDEGIDPRIKRFHCLVSLMLSSQTRDQANWDCMQRLISHNGLTPEKIVDMDVNALEKIIYPVSFYKNKAKNIINATKMILEDFKGEIPDTVEGLLKLPGVGLKMAHICMKAAWNVTTGIGVDTHVHRISNWLRWTPKDTKTPEETRQVLEKWLPFELWDEVNHLLVGFGQTICTSVSPKCDKCLLSNTCPSAFKYSAGKKKAKKEDLEF